MLQILKYIKPTKQKKGWLQRKLFGSGESSADIFDFPSYSSNTLFQFRNYTNYNQFLQSNLNETSIRKSKLLQLYPRNANLYASYLSSLTNAYSECFNDSKNAVKKQLSV